MLKKCLYIYAMAIFCATAVEASDDAIINNKNNQQLAACPCHDKKPPVDKKDESPAVAKIEDDNQDLEETNLFACDEDKSTNLKIV